MNDTPKSRAADMRRQRARDAEALNAWVQDGCPMPLSPMKKNNLLWADMLKWIRKEYGKDETKWVPQFSPPK